MYVTYDNELQIYYTYDSLIRHISSWIRLCKFVNSAGVSVILKFNMTAPCIPSEIDISRSSQSLTRNFGISPNLLLTFCNIPLLGVFDFSSIMIAEIILSFNLLSIQSLIFCSITDCSSSRTTMWYLFSKKWLISLNNSSPISEERRISSVSLVIEHVESSSLYSECWEFSRSRGLQNFPIKYFLFENTTAIVTISGIITNTISRNQNGRTLSFRGPVVIIVVLLVLVTGYPMVIPIDK